MVSKMVSYHSVKNNTKKHVMYKNKTQHGMPTFETGLLLCKESLSVYVIMAAE